MGLLIAIAASITHATTDAAKKALTGRLDALTALTGFVLFGLPLAAIAWWIDGFSGMPRPGFWSAAAVSVALNLVANLLFFEAVYRSPLSLTIPFLAFTPAFLIATGWAINGEVPTPLGCAGIGLIVLGALLMHARAMRGGARELLRAIIRERGTVLMIGVSVIWSVTSAVDKVALLHAGSTSYAVLWHIGMAVPLLIATAIRRRLPPLAHHVVPATATAALHVAGVLMQFSALHLLQVAYVIAIKRAGMLVGILYGWLWFGEREIGQRLLGAAVMVAGVLCITLA